MALSTMIWQLGFIIIIPVVSAGAQYEAAPNVTAGRSSPQSQLYIKLMDEYGPQSLRPIYNQSDQIQVGLGAIPASLVALEDREQTLSLQLSMTMTWTDQKLRWDPSDHEGVRSLVIDVEDIWKPDIILLESIGDTFAETNNGYATVNYKGELIWYNMVVTVTFCKLLIRYFPFDMQHCNLSFTSWNYDLSQIDFFYVHELTTEEQIDQFVVNGAWDITGLTVEHINHTKGCDPNYCPLWPSIRFVCEFERTQASFYATNILMPCIVLSLMNLLVFVLPTEAGEKMSFVMTNVLTLVLFQQLVATMLPPSGDDTPLFSMHVFWMIVFGSVAIFWTVLVIVVYFEKKHYPRRLYILLTSFRSLYYNLPFGREEANTRRYMNIARSRQVLADIMREGEEDELREEAEEERSSTEGIGNGGGLTDTVERWTSDGVKIYKATQEPLPIDGTEESQPPMKIKDRIKLIFCGHCGQLNSTKIKLKNDNFSFDPKDERLWQETANLLDKFMSYFMVMMTGLVYFILIFRFATHDPHEYRSANH